MTMQFHTRALNLTLLAFCLLADIPSWSWRYWVSQFADVETILLACVLKGHFHTEIAIFRSKLDKNLNL